MADISPTAAAFRAVADDPEDSLTLWAASGYTPAKGDLVALSAADTVNLCDATTANGLVEPIGFVKSVQAVRTASGAAGHRVTVILRGLVDGFTGLTAGGIVYNDATPGKVDTADPTTTGVVGKKVGIAVNATQIYVCLPSL